MKHLKRWLALAVSAALALVLLTGCHTGGISSRLLLDLLAGELENVQVETDSTFDRALKAAVQKGGSDPDAVLDALIEELNLSGGAVNFSISGIGNASAGRQSLNVVFQPGSNPSTAANNTATGWLGVLRGLSGSGEYSGLVSAVQVEGGYILAISVTVEQPGNLGSDDDDDDNDPTPAPDLGYTIESDGSYTVTTADGLNAWADAVLAELEKGSSSIDCTLASDITLPSVGENESNWTPIGNYNDNIKAYTGTFDGGGHSITGLKISNGGDYAGLFGYIGSGGVVKNLTLANVDISGGWDVGGVAGINVSGTITACYATGSVSGSANVGGVVGSSDGSITACYSTGDVTGTSWVGGVVGVNHGTITACYWSGSVTGGKGIGGGSGYDSKDAIEVTDGNWTNAVDAMNTALADTGSEWQYELTSGLPTLKKK